MPGSNAVQQQQICKNPGQEPDGPEQKNEDKELDEKDGLPLLLIGLSQYCLSCAPTTRSSHFPWHIASAGEQFHAASCLVPLKIVRPPMHAD